MLVRDNKVQSNPTSVNCDDALLVAQAKKELPYVTVAYETLVKQHYSLIYRTSLGILKDASEAEETSQAILLKIFNGLPRFEGKSSFKTWMMKIVTNTCFSRYKKLKKDQGNFAEFFSEKVHEQEGVATESVWNESFGAMISTLPDIERQILTLRFVSELSLEEIAAVMGIGLSATKMKLYRALEKLSKEELLKGNK